MSPVRLVAGVGAIVAGLAGALYSARNQLPNSLTRQVPVYVTMQPLTAGEQVTQQNVRVYEVPAAAVSSTTLVAPRQSPFGQYATTNIPQYAILYQGEVASWPNGIPPGMQAVDVPVQPSSLAGVTPGEWVSVYGNVSVRGGGQGVAEILPAVEVLGLYTSSLQLVTPANPGQPSIVRFAVTAAQAAALAQAMSGGGSLFIVQGAAPTEGSSSAPRVAPGPQATQKAPVPVPSPKAHSGSALGSQGHPAASPSHGRRR